MVNRAPVAVGWPRTTAVRATARGSADGTSTTAIPPPTRVTRSRTNPAWG